MHFNATLTASHVQALWRIRRPRGAYFGLSAEGHNDTSLFTFQRTVNVASPQNNASTSLNR
jgi:hypothetical protein